MLENYTYHQFQNELGRFLTSGRFVWYVTGNFCPVKAIELAEKVMDLLDLEHYNIEDKVDVRVVAIPPGTCCLLETPLEDEENENSCILTYYEVGRLGGDIAQLMTNEMVMQHLQEALLDELKTKQQLGDVVESYVVENRGVIGDQFLV